jgi:hypothetical protein
MTDTEQDIVTLPSEIVAEAKKFASLLREHAELLEAAAKMRKAAADAHIPELAQQLDKFWRDQAYDGRTIPEVEDFCEKIAVYLHRFLPWDAICEITSWQRWDDEEGWGLDTSLLHIGAASTNSATASCPAMKCAVLEGTARCGNRKSVRIVYPLDSRRPSCARPRWDRNYLSTGGLSRLSSTKA